MLSCIHKSIFMNVIELNRSTTVHPSRQSTQKRHLSLKIMKISANYLPCSIEATFVTEDNENKCQLLTCLIRLEVWHEHQTIIYYYRIITFSVCRVSFGVGSIKNPMTLPWFQFHFVAQMIWSTHHPRKPLMADICCKTNNNNQKRVTK